MVKEVNIAVAITLVDKAFKECVELMDYLDDEYGINFIKNSQHSSHITLSVGLISEDKLTLLFEILGDVFNDKMFIISTHGLGIFLQQKLNLHIRWKHNTQLYKLKYRIEERLKNIWQADTVYNDNNNWLAKSSLAYGDFTYSDLSYINFDKIKIKNVDMQVRELSVIQFENEKKEQELYRLVLDKENEK